MTLDLDLFPCYNGVWWLKMFRTTGCVIHLYFRMKCVWGMIGLRNNIIETNCYLEYIGILKSFKPCEDLPSSSMYLCLYI